MLLDSRFTKIFTSVGRSQTDSLDEIVVLHGHFQTMRLNASKLHQNPNCVLLFYLGFTPFQLTEKNLAI